MSFVSPAKKTTSVKPYFIARTEQGVKSAMSPSRMNAWIRSIALTPRNGYLRLSPYP